MRCASIDDIDREDGVDIDGFSTLAERGLALLRRHQASDAIPLLEAAEAMFVPDDIPDGPDGERCRRIHAVVARALAEEAADRGDHDRAIHYFLHLIEADPYDSECHLGLVTVAAKAGRHGEARRFYRTYRARMERIAEPAAPFPGPGRV